MIKHDEHKLKTATFFDAQPFTPLGGAPGAWSRLGLGLGLGVQARRFAGARQTCLFVRLGADLHGDHDLEK